MSKEDYNKKVQRSSIIPQSYKKIYQNDFNELQEEAEKSKEELDNQIKTLTINQLDRIRSFLSII